MLDNDLADLYDVDTKVLNQSVKRNLLRFPNDFMFQLSQKEFENLKSQSVTSRWGEEEQIHMRLPNKVLQCYPVCLTVSAPF